MQNDTNTKNRSLKSSLKDAGENSEVNSSKSNSVIAKLKEKISNSIKLSSKKEEKTIMNKNLIR